MILWWNPVLSFMYSFAMLCIGNISGLSFVPREPVIYSEGWNGKISF